MTHKVTHDDLAAFAAALNAKLAEWHPIGLRPTIAVEPGLKYARLVTQWSDTQRSAYGFVDLATGDLLKCDGWKRPARGVRGNIFGVDPLAGCTPYGMAYAR